MVAAAARLRARHASAAAYFAGKFKLPSGKDSRYPERV
jgi:hypothetical protein